MKDPLRKTHLRDLKNGFGEYLIIFLFMVLLIGICSGFLITDNSYYKIYNESFEKYNVEDGHFETMFELSDQTKDRLKEKAEIFQDFFIEGEIDGTNKTLRLYKERSVIDQYDLLEGKEPETSDEIVIDRLFAETNGYGIGSVLKIDGLEFTVSGLVALSDYSSLFESNADMMFDNSIFGVGVLTVQGFDRFPVSMLHYNYAWKLLEPAEDDESARIKSDEIRDILNEETVILNFLPAYMNKAITFVGEDMGSDRVMIMLLCYFIIAIISFVFGVTINNRISREARAIGTLRASGYTRAEIIRHYLFLPVVVCLLGAVVGNIIGYTIVIDYFKEIYDTNYSLPTFELTANIDAFLLTTLVPIVILVCITSGILYRRLLLSPQKFLQSDLSRKKRAFAFPIPKRMVFMRKFELRTFFSNLVSYLILFIGLIFTGLMMLFGFLLTPVLDNYAELIKSSMIAQNQYILAAPVATETEGAERFAVISLETQPNMYMTEDILIYGIEPDSSYLPEIAKAFGEGEDVVVSENLLKKYRLDTGEDLNLKEKYSDKTYSFEIDSTYPYDAALAVFIPVDDFNQIFGNDPDYYNGYFSDREITDIEDTMILSQITVEDMMRISNQLSQSFGAMMDLVIIVSLVIDLFLIFLLTKTIIEKNEMTISTLKILGFSKRELYLLFGLPTVIALILGTAIAIPVSNVLLKLIFESYLYTEMTGYIPYVIPNWILIMSFLLTTVCGSLIVLIELRRINKIPMDMVLKNVT